MMPDDLAVADKGDLQAGDSGLFKQGRDFTLKVGDDRLGILAGEQGRNLFTTDLAGKKRQGTGDQQPGCCRRDSSHEFLLFNRELLFLLFIRLTA
jgi:hypothetical protein